MCVHDVAIGLDQFSLVNVYIYFTNNGSTRIIFWTPARRLHVCRPPLEAKVRDLINFVGRTNSHLVRFLNLCKDDAKQWSWIH